MPKFKLIPTSLIALIGLSLVGAAILTRGPYHLVKHSDPSSVTQTSVSKNTPLPLNTSSAGHPAVAGVASQAAQATVAATPITAKLPPIPKPTMAPAPVSNDYVNLTISMPGNPSTFKVNLLSGADACSVLKEALAEGKISSLSINDSTAYMQEYHSAMVTAINGYPGAGWIYSALDDSGKPLPAPGCSQTIVKAHYSVTWKPA
jgi:hypothetical protein